MKRLAVSITLFLCLVVAAFASNGSAGKGLKWDYKDGILTISGKGSMKDFGKDRPWIPSKVYQLNVDEGITHIGANLCRGCGNLKSVSLPSTLKSIGHDAFNGCVTLAEIHIPYGVEEVGDKAFYECKGFVEIDVPITIKRIGVQAFAKSTNISTLRLSQGIESIGERAFDGCTSLVSISDLPNFISSDNIGLYGFSKLAFNKYQEKKEKISAMFGRSDSDEDKYRASVNFPTVSDIDEDIPYTGLENINTFALIIANENYAKLANVPYAHNDGDTFSLYCRRTLGIPQ